MVSDSALIEVQNLTGHPVGYNSYDGKHRVFDAQQIMKIPAEEIRQLNYSRGGSVLLRNHLSVHNQELARELGISDDSFEHEYNWTKDDVVNLLLTGSLDALKDALDFAPAGIIDLIVDTAVELKIPDVTKRQAIFEVTGRDVNTMITLVEKSQETTTEETEAPRGRRVEAAATAGKTRRVAD